jgi:glycosyltransferase involved in cell wall biosynthesis
MKAAFVTPNLNVGGLERQWSILLPGLVERGLATEVFTLDGEGRFFEELVVQGIRAQCLELHGRLNVLGALGAARTVASRRPDVIFTAGESAHVVGQLASRRTKTPHVAAIHSMPEHPSTRRRRLIVRFVAPHVAASTAVTSAQLAFLRSLGFDTTATRVIPSGVAAVDSRVPRDAVRAELGAGDDTFVAVLVAAMRPEKRVELFIDAVVSANLQNAAIRGFVAGGGPELDRVRGLCAETGSIVTALGPRTDVTELIHAADVMCLTSDAEALPLAVLEAMAGGRPVIATDVGGVRDAVVDGETGFLVEPGDCTALTSALTTLAADPRLAHELGEAARGRHGELFTPERMIDAHYMLIRHLSSATGQSTRTGRNGSGPV